MASGALRACRQHPEFRMSFRAPRACLQHPDGMHAENSWALCDRALHGGPGFCLSSSMVNAAQLLFPAAYAAWLFERAWIAQGPRATDDRLVLTRVYEDHESPGFGALTIHLFSSCIECLLTLSTTSRPPM